MGTRASDNWTPRQEARLIRLRALGFTFTICAESMGKTRAAVQSKWSRMMDEAERAKGTADA